MSMEPRKVLARVVVASGTSHMRDSLQVILHGCEAVKVTEVVATGSQLLGVLRRNLADIIVIDSGLPGLNAETLAETLRNSHFTGRIMYMGSCCIDRIAPIIESYGGIVTDRCIGARDFLDQVLSMIDSLPSDASPTLPPRGQLGFYVMDSGS